MGSAIIWPNSAGVSTRGKRSSTRSAVDRGEMRRRSSASVTLVNPLRQSSILLSLAVDFATALVFLITGGFAYWQRPSDPRARVFFVLCSSFGLARFLSLGPSYVYPFNLGENIVSVILLAALALLFFPALLHFCLIFPQPRPALTKYPHLLRTIYGTAGALTALITSLLIAEVLAHIPVQMIMHRHALPRHWMDALNTAEQHATAVLAPCVAILGFIAYRLIKRVVSTLKTGGWKSLLIGRAGLTFATSIVTVSALCALAEVIVSATGWSAVREAPFVAFMIAMVLHVAALGITQSLVFPIAACVALYHSYREAGPEERIKLRWPLWGIVGAVAVYVISQPVIDASNRIFQVDPESVYFAGVFFFREHGRTALLVLIPVSMAFAILKHRLMDIDLYMRRTATYGLLSGLLGLVFLILTAGLARLLSVISGARNEWAPIFSTVIVAAAVIPLRNRVQGVVNGRFFHGKPNYFEALRQLTGELSRVRDRNTMLRTAAEGMRAALQSRWAACFIRSSDDRAFRAAAHTGERGNSRGYPDHPSLEGDGNAVGRCRTV